MNKLTLGYLRLFLALSVFVMHYNFYKLIFDNFYDILHIKTKLSFVGEGNLAVIGFFVISGYLVSLILSNRYPNKSFEDFFHFVLSRYLRVYPLFLILLIILFFLYIIFPYDKNHYSLLNIVSFSLLLPLGIYDFFLKIGTHLYDYTFPKFWEPTWTLALDFVFYPLGFFFYKNKYLLYSSYFIFFIFFIFIWMISPSNTGHMYYSRSSWWKLYFSTTITPNILAFMSGMIAFDLKNKKNSIKFKKINFILFLSIIIYIMYLPFYISPFAANFISLLVFPLLIFELAKNGQGKMESFLGNFTFSLYLIHKLTLYLVIFYLGKIKVISLLISLFLNVLISLILAIFVEGRYIEQKRKVFINNFKLECLREKQLNIEKISYFIIMFFCISMIFYYHFVSYILY